MFSVTNRTDFYFSAWQRRRSLVRASSVVAILNNMYVYIYSASLARCERCGLYVRKTSGFSLYDLLCYTTVEETCVCFMSCEVIVVKEKFRLGYSMVIFILFFLFHLYLTR